MAALVSSGCCLGSTTLSSPLHGLPDCFRPASCTSAMMGLCLAQLAPAYWCDFDAVSSRLPPPFSSLCPFPLVASAVQDCLPFLSLLFVFLASASFTLLPLVLASTASLSGPSPCFTHLARSACRCFQTCGPSSLRKVVDSNHRSPKPFARCPSAPPYSSCRLAPVVPALPSVFQRLSSLRFSVP